MSDMKYHLRAAQNENADGNRNYVTRSPVWWHRRSVLERTLFIITVIALLACVGLCIALAVVITTWYDKAEENVPSKSSMAILNEESGVCLSPICVISAAELISNMDETANPCENFYQYACGGFEDKIIIPDDKPSVSAFSLISDKLKDRIKAMIEKPKDVTEPETFWKIKDIYAACINTDRIESLGSSPLSDLLNSLGGWPVVSGTDWKSDDFDWVTTIYKFHAAKLNVDFLFDINVLEDSKNTTYRLITLDQPKFGMPDRSYLIKGLNDSLVIAYHQLMVKVAVLLGATQSEAEEQLMGSLQFEISLAHFALSIEERRDLSKLYHKMTVGDLSTINSGVDWLEFFNTILPDEIQSTEPVVVKVPTYLKEALEFISKTPKRTIANYIMWRVALKNLKNLDKRFRKARMELYAKLTGQTTETPRWMTCVTDLTTYMQIGLGAMYVQNYFNRDSKATATDVVLEIRNEFEQILNDVSWMNPETKANAHEKLDAMAQHVGYPEELLDNKILDDFFSSLSVNADDHFGNLIFVWNFATAFMYSLLRKPVIKMEWMFYGNSAEVNAFYSLEDNSISLPAGILQGIFFDSTLPKYLNFGGIGFVIGHEITHGFDDQGRQLNKNGDLKNWWDNSTDERFQQKVHCIIDQFSNYTLPNTELRVNGIITQGENIADNGGLKIAYHAYKKWTERNGDEALLPGMKLTQRQLFWLNSANIWCSKVKPEKLTASIKTDAHSPSIFRVNGAMANFEQFSEDFNCPVGSVMNPIQKCSVW